jgi:Common central domain of tyrosinase/IPT/TIG domain
MAVRKNVASLSTKEKTDLCAAIKAVKKSGKYDTYVLQHSATMRTPSPPNTNPNICNMAHRGPSFCPWHREFLRRFEKDLGVPLPYWDWAADQASGNPKTAPVWQNDLMGPNGFIGAAGDPNNERVLSGPFAHKPADPTSWSTIANPVDPSEDASVPWLTRNFGAMMTMPDGSQMPMELPTPKDVQDSMSVVPYDSSPWNVTSNGFRNFLEGFIGPGMHNASHMWVGGSMMPSTSPNDPVFWLHHANVDRIWANWQRKWYKVQDYLPVSGGPTGHNLNDPMSPWGGTSTPKSVLDIFALGYWYDDAPLPVVTGISPSSGKGTGGTKVVITGSGFMGATAVKFGPASSIFTVDSDTQISAFSTGGAGKQDVTVKTPIGTSAVSAADQFTYAAVAPTPTPTPTPTPHPPTPTPHPPTPTPGSGSSGSTGHAVFAPPPFYPPPILPPALPPPVPPPLPAPAPGLGLPVAGDSVAIVGVVGLAALVGIVAATGIVAVVALAKEKQ